MNWIHRAQEEPSKEDGPILVYGTVFGKAMLVVVHVDYGEWVDVVDSCTVEFQWWCRLTKPPQTDGANQ